VLEQISKNFETRSSGGLSTVTKDYGFTAVVERFLDGGGAEIPRPFTLGAPTCHLTS